MKKILITGGTGFIGRHLSEFWKNRTDLELTATGRRGDGGLYLPVSVHYKAIELTDKNAVFAFINELLPATVIHSAAMSRPNDCELDKKSCHEINVNATGYLVEACKLTGSELIFMSTDMVFGDDGPYTEEDKPCPVNYYGETKVMAEEIIRASGLNYAIVRTVLVYGKKLAGQQNTFLHWVYDNIKAGKTIRVFTDQHRTACFVNDLCNGIDALVQTGAQGIFHLCGSETFTPFEIAKAVARYHGFDEELVQPVTNAEMKETARRPKNCTLNIDKAKGVLGYSTTSLQDALKIIF